MDLPMWQALVLGLVQGFTEFLPISSSGHLVLFQHLFGVKLPGITFEVVVHAGTLLAVLIVYKNDVIRLINAVLPGSNYQRSSDRRLLGLVLIGTVPAVIAALGLKSLIDEVFRSLTAVSVGWLFTAGLLYFADLHLRRPALPAERSGNADAVSGFQALTIGILQAIAIFPGVSRSGSTITCGLLLGLSRQAAARFSFLLAIPAIAGGLVLDIGNIAGQIAGTSSGTGGAGVLVVGFLAAAVSGYLAIRFLLRLLERGRLIGFSIYCFVLGSLLLFLS